MDSDDFKFIGCLVLAVVLISFVVGVPTYLIDKSSCETFAELQHTESKFTIGGDCYIKLSNGSWVDKSRWYFYESLQH